MGSRGRTALGSAAGVSAAFAGWQGLAAILPGDLAAGLPERLALTCAGLLAAVGRAQPDDRGTDVAACAERRVGPAGWTRRRIAAGEPAGADQHGRAACRPLLAVAAGVSSDRMRFVVAAGVVFAVARLVFWGGYLLGPMMRAPGMAATFAVNIATLAAAIWVWWP